MADPYWRYHNAAAVARDPHAAAFPGHLHPDGPAVHPHAVHPHAVPLHPPWSSSAVLQNNSLRSPAYGVGDFEAVGRQPQPAHAGLSSVPSVGGVRPLEDPTLPRTRASLGDNSNLADLERYTPRKSEGPREDESNMLFVNGLPSDCTRREVGHLFRPFIGFKDIRLLHKEPRHSGDKARVLCFVEFVDAKCAMTALSALQGYRFDDKKPDAPILRIEFAHFPLRLPS